MSIEKMVATSERLIKPKVSSCKKVSKPLMEKKRRARINTCLDQLKTLLESVYSNNIRKRKFEKADILELTVKHLKHLQNIEKGFSFDSLHADYEAGFKTCLSGVSKFLLMNDRNPACRSNTHTHLFHGLQSLNAITPNSSTVDSDASRPFDVMLFAFPGSLKAHRSHRTESSKKGKASLNGLQQNKHVSVNSTNPQQNYWRPW